MTNMYDRDEMDAPRDAPTVGWLVPTPDTYAPEITKEALARAAAVVDAAIDLANSRTREREAN